VYVGQPGDVVSLHRVQYLITYWFELYSNILPCNLF
jgi:hypothetical protein